MGILFSCSTKEEGVEVTSLKPVELPDTDAGVISFVSGDVTLVKNGETLPAESGDVVTSNSTVKTGAGASCEITLGETAIVSIEEDTVCEIRTLLLAETSDVGLEVALGSILCKVKKLTENDTFNVKTDSAVCGVRGTEFLVRKSKTGETVVAVKTGRVALLPPEVDAGDLENYAKLTYTEIVQVVEKLEALATSVSADEEIVVRRDTLKSAEEVYTALETVAGKAMANETVTKAELANLKKVSDNAAIRTAKPEEKPVALSETNKQKLAEIETLASFKGAGSSIADETATDEQREKPRLVKVNVKTEPANAEIFVEGVSTGTGSVSLLVTEDTDLEILVKLAGYRDRTLRIKAEEGKDAQYRIGLERIGGEPVKITATDETETDKGSSVTEGKAVSDGKTVTETAIMPEKEKESSVTKETKTTEGEKEKTDKTTQTEERSTKPEKAIVKAAYQVAHTTIIGTMNVFDGKVILADKYGIVTCADLSGNRIWTLSTDNNPNENSYPMVIGGKVYFSGAQELVIINAANGTAISERKLDSGSSHIFGRHVVKFEGNGLFPKDNAIEVFDLGNGSTLREIVIPKKSSMTPATYKGDILIVDQEGTFLFINGASGAIEAEIKTGAIQPIGLSVSVVKDKAFAAGRNGTAICVDLSNKTLVWEKSLQAGRKVSVSSDFETGPGELFAYSNGTMYALSQSTGEALYPPVTGLSGPPLYFGGSLYYGTVDKKFIVANAKTGRIVKSATLDQKVTSKPVFDAEGTILAGMDSGVVAEIDISAFK